MGSHVPARRIGVSRRELAELGIDDEQDARIEVLRRAYRIWNDNGSPHTKAARASDFRLFARHALGREVPPWVLFHVLTRTDQLDAYDYVKAWIDDQKARSLQPTTLNRRLVNVKSFIRFLNSFAAVDVRWDLSALKGHKYSPYGRAEGPEPAIVRDAISRLQAESMLGHKVSDPPPKRIWKPARDLFMLTALYHNGVRVSSLSSMRWDQVRSTESNGVRRYSVLVYLKGGKEKRKPLSVLAGAALMHWKAILQSVNGGKLPTYVCASLRGKRELGELLTNKGISDRIKKHTGVSPHKIRHTMLSRLWELTGDLRMVSEMADHANPATTRIYLDAQGLGKDTRKAVDMMASDKG